MFNHEPSHYWCPFCAFVRGEWDDYNASTDLHVHVFPRHQGDELYRRHEDAGFAAPKERALWAALLRDRLQSAERVAR